VIADHKIVENRQPVKAAVDVLEYLGYIVKQAENPVDRKNTKKQVKCRLLLD
jgi:hypothetical protein